MKKLRFTILAAFATLSIISCRQVPEDPAASDKYRLIWNNDPTTSITIGWDQSESVANPAVYYGVTDYGRKYWKYENEQNQAIRNNRHDMNTYFSELKNLMPDTSYYFVIKDDRGVSERYWFKTAPDTQKPFTFIAGGDTKSSGDTYEAGRNSDRMVSKLRPLFVMFTGDFTSGDGTNPEYWHAWLNDWQELATTEDGRLIPLVPVMGNHERGYMANLNYIFNAPFQGNDSSDIYYSFSFGNDFFHIIALNSQIEVGGKQQEWLENDLKKHQDYTFKVAGYHKPFFPHTARKSEHEDQYKQWAWLFYKYGLDVSFDADSHMHKITYPLKPDSSENSYMGFVRDDENGTLYAGEGSWGAHPRPNDDDKPWTLTSGSFNQVKWVHVFPETEEENEHMKIFTVLTASYDENDNQTLYNQQSDALTEDNLFAVPENLELYETDSTGQYVRYPYMENE